MKCTVSIFPVYKFTLKGKTLLKCCQMTRVPLLQAVKDETHNLLPETPASWTLTFVPLPFHLWPFVNLLPPTNPSASSGQKILPVCKVCKLADIYVKNNNNNAPVWLQPRCSSHWPQHHHTFFEEPYCKVVVIYIWIIYRPCCLDNRHLNLVAHTARIVFCINLNLIIDMKITIFCK